MLERGTSEQRAGSSLKEAVNLAEYVRDLGYMPEQVQDFYPTPSTISTCMYYTGLDPRTMEPVYVPVNPHEKAMQRALIQYKNPAMHGLVEEALKKAGRQDLIGFGPKCLIRPEGARENLGNRHENLGNGHENARSKHESLRSGNAKNKRSAGKTRQSAETHRKKR